MTEPAKKTGDKFEYREREVQGMIIHKKEEMNMSSVSNIFQPLISEEAQDFLEKRNLYRSAIREVSTKLEILDDEFHLKYEYNPIHHIESRVKSVQSIIAKLKRKGIETISDNLEMLTDIAGIRVICNYIDDVYTIAGLLTKQDDIELIREKDYIQNPKASGYRSLHIVVLVPVFLAESVEKMPVEIQLRTIVMDAWASLEHELRYKRNDALSENDIKALKECAASMEDIDKRMQDIHKNVREEERV